MPRIRKLKGPDGRVAATYVRDDYGDLPNLLVAAEPAAPRAVLLAAMLERWPGRLVTVGEIVGPALVDAGAATFRHYHVMYRDLRDDPPPPDWARLSPPGGLLVSATRAWARPPVTALDELTSRAYPPGHPDRRNEDAFARGARANNAALRRRVRVCRAGGYVYDGDSLVAAVVMTRGAARAVAVVNVMRSPEARYAGLGGLLLRRGLARSARHGHRLVVLLVTDGNPARRTYERLGFRVFASRWALVLP